MITKCAYCKKLLERIPSRAKGKNYCNANHQMRYEYDNKIRDKKTITKKANESVRLHGIPKLRGRETWIKGKTKENNSIVEKLAIQRLGQGNPMWKENKAPIRPNKNYAWHIKKRDGFRCRLCNYEKNLEVHHIKPWAETQDNSSDNLVTLCHDCHYKVHDLYRKKLFAEYENILNPVVILK